MSGGIDSSVACLLLSRQGYEVVGITMKLFDSGAKACDMAAAVCKELKIPHYVFDMASEFQNEVILPFIRAYTSGLTPNPCLGCNRIMKFGHLLNKAQQIGAGRLATGHYARVVQGGSRYLLFRGFDRGKDQSYALHGLSQEALSKTVFPLGELTKTEVRDIAGKWGLSSADNPESQEICFVTSKTYREFLKAQGAVFKPGPILDSFGNVLGTHEGLPMYTVGQRRGLGLAKTPKSKIGPFYVVDLDVKENAVIVGSREEAHSRGCVVDNVNLISADVLTEPVTGTCMVRYRGEETDAVMKPAGQGVTEVIFSKPQFAVTPGQALVFYQGEMVFGGGIISRRIP